MIAILFIKKAFAVGFQQSVSFAVMIGSLHNHIFLTTKIIFSFNCNLSCLKLSVHTIYKTLGFVTESYKRAQVESSPRILGVEGEGDACLNDSEIAFMYSKTND